MCGLGEKMKNKPNEERISRKAASLQWTGDNTQAVMDRLAQHGIIGELYRDIYIQVYTDGSYSDTLNIGDWLVEGEDGRMRLYTDGQHKLMYRPINDELERLKCEIERLKVLERQGLENFNLLLQSMQFKAVGEGEIWK